MNEELINKVLKISERTVLPPKQIGGQSCGIEPSSVMIHNEDLKITITIGCHRSLFRNKDLAETLFKLAVSEILGD